jgi:hypothetical protein
MLRHRVVLVTGHSPSARTVVHRSFQNMRISNAHHVVGVTVVATDLLPLLAGVE